MRGGSSPSERTRALAFMILKHKEPSQLGFILVVDQHRVLLMQFFLPDRLQTIFIYQNFILMEPALQ